MNIITPSPLHFYPHVNIHNHNVKIIYIDQLGFKMFLSDWQTVFPLPYLPPTLPTLAQRERGGEGREGGRERGGRERERGGGEGGREGEREIERKGEEGGERDGVGEGGEEKEERGTRRCRRALGKRRKSAFSTVQ